MVAAYRHVAKDRDIRQLISPNAGGWLVDHHFAPFIAADEDLDPRRFQRFVDQADEEAHRRANRGEADQPRQLAAGLRDLSEDLKRKTADETPDGAADEPV